ncbi:MAG TPA: alanine/glycine:cation symporter family protein [Flavobacterium sp.]|jgi:alanine or glycine:cation symporter, AGCS family|nr:alanine:cation symporter family protein [Flavobacterium sp.]HQV36385.1 alanine/glycine:cation symporter family protein [Flavobacterium sp.]HQX04271.1 alanine/glycine:cation symporter family protein [Flavobacterium sp.]HRZ31451.1 alanine/glycine:cation symporter family protein [Flavobacterium sp.]HRZ73947.1 alanine/glycine:cation symporter family protein [Flavobacterium sp.]
MKKLFSLFALLLPILTFSQEKGLDEKINDVIKPAVDAMASVFFYKPFASFGFDMPLVVLWLVVGATFFTIYMGFINLKGIKHAYQLIRGDYDKPGDAGEVSHFQALVTALSGTVGLGNIAGVAVAISVGGAGATFWMILAGFLGMSSKFVECTLGVKYRRLNDLGEVSGGPMYYLSEGLKRKGYAGFGKVLAVVFSILAIGGSFGGGNMFQANQSFAQLANVFPVFIGNGFWYGLVVAFFVGIVIIGGIKKIASVTDKIVPFMVGLYVITSLIIIFVNFAHIGDAFSEIFSGAFTADGISGGVIGVLVVGFQRAAFSNEAGVGSAAIAHSAVKTDEPVSEGIVSLLEPFVDTIVVCTMTALVLIFSGYAQDTQGLTGSALTSAAFSSVLPWFKYVLLVAIILFAFSTMISWSYYGMKSWTYLFGNTKKMENVYKILFLVFVVVGSSASLGAVIDFSDMMILGMAFPNILGLYFLSSEVKADLKEYFRKLKSGEIKKFE